MVPCVSDTLKIPIFQCRDLLVLELARSSPNGSLRRERALTENARFLGFLLKKDPVSILEMYPRNPKSLISKPVCTTTSGLNDEFVARAVPLCVIYER